MAVKASTQVTISTVIDIDAYYRYYLLQSSTSAAPDAPTTYPPESASWVDTEPTYTSGSTNSLYFVDCTVFSDGTFTYSDVSVSSSYEAAKEAYNEAVVAQGTANSAEAAAEKAQETADGKNTVFYQTSAPSTSNRKVNDIWFDTDDGNKMYYWNGFAWTVKQFGTSAIANLAITNALIADATIQSAKIANLDAAKITTGVLKAARLAANSITADKLSISDLSALEATIASWSIGDYVLHIEIPDMGYAGINAVGLSEEDPEAITKEAVFFVGADGIDVITASGCKFAVTVGGKVYATELNVSGTATISGAIDGSITGNAASATYAQNAANATNATNATTATKLKTARKIGIGAVSQDFDGSKDVTYALSDIGIQCGDVNVVPSTAGAVTSVKVTFSRAFNTVPFVTATPRTSVPNKVSVGVGDITKTGFTLHAYRTDTTNFYVGWIAVAR